MSRMRSILRVALAVIIGLGAAFSLYGVARAIMTKLGWLGSGPLPDPVARLEYWYATFLFAWLMLFLAAAVQLARARAQAAPLIGLAVATYVTPLVLRIFTPLGPAFDVSVERTPEIIIVSTQLALVAIAYVLTPRTPQGCQGARISSQTEPGSFSQKSGHRPVSRQ